MSRKKDIAIIAPLFSLMVGMSEQAARRTLARLPARELRKRRNQVNGFEETLNLASEKATEAIRQADHALEKVRRTRITIAARNTPPHPTVQ